MRKTKHQIIDEIAAHYNLGNRSVQPSSDARPGFPPLCLYNGPNGTHCAFAYMMINPLDAEQLNSATAREILNEFGESVLKEEFRGHQPDFYVDIQRLHDTSTNWTETGLSDKGKQYVDKLKTSWIDN